MILELSGYKIRPFLMTVPEFPEKTEAALKHFKEVGIVPELFPCFCAYNKLVAPAEPVCGLTTLHTYEVDNPGSGYHIGPKSVALCVSFQAFWIAASFMPDTHVLFLEWDALFHPNWRERTEQALKDVPPDFDFLFLGSCCCKGRPMKQVKGEVWDVRYPQCNHAQIIAKKAMGTLLRTQRKIYAPADISLAFHAFPHLKVYTLLPRCVDQHDTFIPP